MYWDKMFKIHKFRYRLTPRVLIKEVVLEDTGLQVASNPPPLLEIGLMWKNHTENNVVVCRTLHLIAKDSAEWLKQERVSIGDLNDISGCWDSIMSTIGYHRLKIDNARGARAGAVAINTDPAPVVLYALWADLVALYALVAPFQPKTEILPWNSPNHIGDVLRPKTIDWENQVIIETNRTVLVGVGGQNLHTNINTTVKWQKIRKILTCSKFSYVILIIIIISFLTEVNADDVQSNQTYTVESIINLINKVQKVGGYTGSVNLMWTIIMSICILLTFLLLLYTHMCKLREATMVGKRTLEVKEPVILAMKELIKQLNGYDSKGLVAQFRKVEHEKNQAIFEHRLKIGDILIRKQLVLCWPVRKQTSCDVMNMPREMELIQLHELETRFLAILLLICGEVILLTTNGTKSFGETWKNINIAVTVFMVVLSIVLFLQQIYMIEKNYRITAFTFVLQKLAKAQRTINDSTAIHENFVESNIIDEDQSTTVVQITGAASVSIAVLVVTAATAEGDQAIITVMLGIAITLLLSLIFSVAAYVGSAYNAKQKRFIRVELLLQNLIISHTNSTLSLRRKSSEQIWKWVQPLLDYSTKSVIDTLYNNIAVCDNLTRPTTKQSWIKTLIWDIHNHINNMDATDILNIIYWLQY